MIFAYKEEFIGPTHNYIKITQGEYKTGTLLIEKITPQCILKKEQHFTAI